MQDTIATADLFADPQALPNGLVYQPDFITAHEETDLLRHVAALPLAEAQYKQYMARRRTVSFGSSYDFGENRLDEAAPIPEFLLPLRDKAAGWAGLPAAQLEHALVTEYRPGTPLGWHRDVPQFAVVVGISLASACRMRFRPYPWTGKASARVQSFALDLAPRSAYVLRDDVRWRWQHSVSPTKALRYSITFRTRKKDPR